MRCFTPLLGSLCCLLLSVSACKKEPIVLEAESFSGVTGDSNYGASAAHGWASYPEQTFSGKRAALTRKPAAEMTFRIPGLRRKSFRAEVIVLNYPGRARNSFELTIGGKTKTLTFGGPEAVAGITRLGDLYFQDAADNEVRIRSTSIGQNYLVIDFIRLVPVSGAVPKIPSQWERKIVQIQGVECEHCVQAEELNPVVHDSDYGPASARGWASYTERTYSNNQAALTRLPGAVMAGKIPDFRPGTYRVIASVLVQGKMPNKFDLQLGTQTKRITFGGVSFPEGIVHLKNIYYDKVADDTIAVRAVEINQLYLIIDALSLEWTNDPITPENEPWHATEVDPVIESCTICIEAETLQAVSPALDYGTTSGLGWGSYEEASFSGKRAALTRLPGAVMHGTIPNFRAGSYLARLTVLNYDQSKTNALDLSIGDQVVRVTYGPNLRTGVIHVRNIYFEKVIGPTITIKAVSIEQPYLVVDRIALERL